jgi:hypothetical protein
MISSNDRPCLVQETALPVFEGGGIEDLTCAHCNHILAARIDPRSLIGLDIECFACKKTTRTPSWPQGETLPKGVISVGSTGRHVISQIPIGREGVFTCDAEIQRIQNSTRIKPLRSDGPVVVTIQALDIWEAELNNLTRNKFLKPIAAARRAHASGNKRFVQCPPAWALVHLRDRLLANKLGSADADTIAIAYIAQIHGLLHRWYHHHHFPLITSALSSEFNHTVTMLTAAGFLTDYGNDMGITDTISAKGRSPDLYVYTGRQSRFSFEVKAPDVLFWPSPALSVQDVEKYIYRSLNSAKGQITGETGGAVIIGASHPDPSSKRNFVAALTNVISSGKVSSRIAAVLGVFHNCDHYSNSSENTWQARSQVWGEKNPKFVGENPVFVS